MKVRGGAILAVALAAAGCAAPGGGSGESERARGVRIWGVERMASGFSSTLRGGQPPLELVGADAATTAAVAAAMRAPPAIGGGPFRAAGPGEARAPRLVLAVGGGRAACDGGGSAGTGAPTAEAFWCTGTRVLARGQGSGAAFTGPDAPGFADAASRLAHAVMQPERVRTPGGR